jgi:hypothetical protein
MTYVELDWRDIHWAVRRMPKNIRDLLKTHGPKLFVAGGYIRSIVSGDKVSDIDLFCSSKEYAEACAKELHGPDPTVRDSIHSSLEFRESHRGDRVFRLQHRTGGDLV